LQANKIASIEMTAGTKLLLPSPKGNKSLDARPSKPFINGPRESVHFLHFVVNTKIWDAGRQTASVENASVARNFGASLHPLRRLPSGLRATCLNHDDDGRRIPIQCQVSLALVPLIAAAGTPIT
jgi:hypothetical protein